MGLKSSRRDTGWKTADAVDAGVDPDSVAFGSIVINDHGEPEWVDHRFPWFFLVLGAIAAIAVGQSAADQPPAFAIGLVIAAVTPWLLLLLHIHLSDRIFAGAVLSPIGFLVLGGQSLGLVDLEKGAPQLVLMLVVGVVGQFAVVGTARFATAVTLTAIAIVLAGAIIGHALLDSGPWLVGVVLAAAGGRAFRSSIQRLSELRQAQQALADKYLADERRRIAREVHDIVAHTMSVTMLHITAARMAIDRDPDAAHAALTEAERAGRASMDDIRSIVRLLRTDESPVDAALPTEADIRELVEQHESAGHQVNLTQNVDPQQLRPEARLAVYRIAQESLTNAARHGAGTAAIELRADESEIHLEVRNPTPGTPGQPGAGLPGMRERCEALGGNFTAGPTGQGEWRVHARIPR